MPIEEELVLNAPLQAFLERPPHLVHFEEKMKLQIKPLGGEDFLNEIEKNKTLGYVSGQEKEGLFGIEVELEGQGLPEKITKYWSTRRDGSLREGKEFVLVKPLDIEAAKTAIIFLTKALHKQKSEIAFSLRTSVHVHVNLCDFTKAQVNSFLYLSHIFEEVLVKYSGKSREGNRFCLRAKDAGEKIEHLLLFIKSEEFRFFDKNLCKYSAINLSSLGEFGSVEFRSMRGTLDTTVLFPWLEVLKSIKELSAICSIKDLSRLVKETPRDLFRMVFKQHDSLFEYKELDKGIKDAYLRLIELPYVARG